MRAYHFIPQAFGLSALATRRLKIARISELNDPFELLGYDLQEPAARAAVKATKEDLAKTKGLLCFSSLYSNPVLWSHYADRHRGICLGFDLSKDHTFPVIYSDQKAKLLAEDIVGPSKGENAMLKLLGTKFRSWEYETELRMFCALDPTTEENGLYYHDFGQAIMLREIILGALCAVPVANLTALAASIDPAIVIRQARLSEDSFEILA